MRRFRRPPTRSAAIWILLAALAAWRYWSGDVAPPPAETHATGSYHVRRAVDGDTLLLDDGTRVRLIGVNAPESVRPDYPVEAWGPEASQFTRDFVAGGAVRLEFDRERLDQHGRMLAYVYVGDRLLNEELVEQGFARYEPQYFYSEAMKRRFRQAQERARSAQRGIWSGKKNAK